MRQLYVFVILVSICLAAKDTLFCRRNQQNPDGETIHLPSDFKEFSTLIEKYVSGQDDINYIQEIYDEDTQQLYLSKEDKIEKINTWILPQWNTYLEETIQLHEGGKCTSYNVEESKIADSYNITEVKGKPSLPAMSYMILSSDMEKPIFVGDAEVRGIMALMWEVCVYQDWADRTIVANIYYSKPEVQMSGSLDSVPLLITQKVKDNSTSQGYTTERYDYTKYQPDVYEFNPKFQLPDYLACKDRQMAQNLPKMPNTVKYNKEVIDLGDFNAYPTPTLSHYIDYFDTMKNISWSRQDTRGDNSVNEYALDTIHDFTTGNQYDLNYSKGTCTRKNTIDKGFDYKATQSGRLVRQKNPAEFFGLDQGKFQYLGVHPMSDRGIEVEVFTSLQDKDTQNNSDHVMTTFHFATKNWMKKMRFANYFPLIIRKTVTTNSNKKVTDYYKYTRYPELMDNSVDVSPCFPPSGNIYMEVLLNAKFVMVYMSGVDSFYGDFLNALFMHTDIQSSFRIAQLSVEPANATTTQVRFTLVEVPASLGNVPGAKSGSKNAVVYSQIAKAIDAGQFTFQIKNTLGFYNVTAIGYKKDYVDLFSQANQSIEGSTPGAMGGVGVGLLLVGIILGFGTFKGVKRIRNRHLPGPTTMTSKGEGSQVHLSIR